MDSALVPSIRGCSLALVWLAASCASTAALQDSNSSPQAQAASSTYLKAVGGLSQASNIDLTITEENAGPSAIAADVSLDAGYLLGLGVGRRFAGGLAVELEYTHRHSEVNDATSQRFSGPELVATDGSIEARALMCNLIYRLERPWVLTPYAGLGVGYAYRIRTRLERLSGGPVRGYDSDAAAAQLMLGASTSLSSELDGSVELRVFRAFSPDTEFQRARGELKEDYQSWSVLLGLQYGF